MRNQVIFFLMCLLLLVSCKQTSKKEAIQEINNEEQEVKLSDSISANEKWMQAINTKNIDLLSSLYTENAMVLSANGIDLANREEILELIPKVDFVVKSVAATIRIQANDTYDYEIGSFINKDDGIAKHLIIWNTSVGTDKRELEFITETTKSKVNLEDIDKQRAQWIAICNSHNVEVLVETMYSENAMYYNHRPMITGRKDIINEYQYMNSPQYELTLKPILVEPVSDTIVYEIGQCEDSYNGKYILVWQKNTEGIWQVLFDSNI
jgi:ketosteroid isomerase-like protein